MSAPASSKDAPAKASATNVKDPYIDLAERIFVQLEPRLRHARRVGAKKPDPKALAAFSFKLADAFEQATRKPTA